MKERPILFSAPMVRAILAGRKTVTRRIVSAKVPKGYEFDGYSPAGVRCSRPSGSTGEQLLPCPYGAPDDRLWVRETWAPWSHDVEERGEAAVIADAKAQMPWASIVYRAEANGGHVDVKRWRPSIFLPRWASRILLGVVSVRVERLHEITEEDARREGVDDGPGLGGRLYPGTGAARGALGHRKVFSLLWEMINGKRAPWDSNPWVWRVEFRRLP